MSYHIIRERVLFCLVVPYNTLNKEVDTIIGWAESGTFSNDIKGWKFTDDWHPTKPGAEIYGQSLQKDDMLVLLVFCEGDDHVYFVAATKEIITRFRADLAIMEKVITEHELETAS